MNCEGSKLGWLGRSSNRWRQVGLVQRGSRSHRRGYYRTRLGLALYLSPSWRHVSLSLSITATQTRVSVSLIKMGLCLFEYSLSLSLCLAALASHFPFFSFFFLFFFHCFLLSLFGFELLRAEVFFFFFRFTWVMGSALSWPDDGLGEGVHDFWEEGQR